MSTGEACEICSKLAERESAYQKFGWEEHDTRLPEAAGRLVVVKDFKPGSERMKQLWQCPLCGGFYLYETDYEYLVNGSEDEQTLTRLSVGEAAQFLEG